MKKNVLAIVPLREFRDTKRRLRKFLSETERIALSQALFTHVLRSLDCSFVRTVLVVSSDEASVSRIARGHRKILAIKEKKYHGGVSSAVEDGISYGLNKFDDINSIMVVPSDLPLLSSQSIDAAISKLDTYDLIIGPSSKLDGTNLLLFNVDNGRIPLHYNDNSYRNHIREAKIAKIKYAIVKWKEFSWDVDTELDLERIMKRKETNSVVSLVQKMKES